MKADLVGFLAAYVLYTHMMKQRVKAMKKLRSDKEKKAL
jgi:hypothetical protein